MYQLLKLSGPDPAKEFEYEVSEVLDEGETREDLDQLYAVRDSLNEQALDRGKLLHEERYAVRPSPLV